MEFQHVSVLLEETIEGLNIRPNGIYVDGTAGGAGCRGRADLVGAGRRRRRGAPHPLTRPTPVARSPIPGR